MENNTENDLKEIEEIKNKINNLETEHINFCGYKASKCGCCGQIYDSYLKQAKEIAERNIFKGGCGKHKPYSSPPIWCAINQQLCPACEKEKERCDKIQKIYKEITQTD